MIMLGAWELDYHDYDPADDDSRPEPYWISTIGYLQQAPGIIDGFRDYHVYNEFGELMRGAVFFTHWRPLPAPPPMPDLDNEVEWI